MGVVLPISTRHDPLRAIRHARQQFAQAERALGEALLAAHASGLHHVEGHATFGAFLRVEAGIGRRRADRIMREAQASRGLVTTFGLG